MGSNVDTNVLPPPSPVRWFRPTSSTLHLQLPTAPILVANVDTWIALSVQESEKCEEAWKALPKEQQIAAEEAVDSDRPQPDSEEDQADEDETVGVTISEDRLFEVDVRLMELRPIYWKLNAPRIKVKRATWMYDETRPVTKYLSDQLDAAYKSIQPWQPSYQIELETAAGLGPDAHEKLKHPLSLTPETALENAPGTSQNFVIFEDAFTAKISTKKPNQFFTNSFFNSSARNSKARVFAFSGTTVYYGYDIARASSRVASPPDAQSEPEDKSPALTNTLGVADSDNPLRPSRTAQRSNHPRGHKTSRDEQQSRILVGDLGENRVTDLVLIVHGIGQGLASQYESWSFLYAVNLFRQIAKKQAGLPALASILREKQVQFLPIQWRTSFKLGEDQRREREKDGLDNTFDISDITPKNSISTIRDLTNNVLIEVPYFMSHHQGAMIESVCIQANRTYRLWCARNPGFDKYGRVHIIGHSLGSLLSAYILTKQPTFQPSLSQMCPEVVRNCRDRFLFNTSVFFTIGSPLSMFIHINQAQIIARKGRERTKDSPGDEALDREGVFGCFAVDAIYNIFHPSDPIAYLLNPCVDSKAAKDLPPSTVPSFNASVITTISNRFTKLFADVMPRSFGSSSSLSRTHSRDSRPALGHTPSTFELSGHNQVLQGSRAERRFAALNPHGTLDFQLASEGSISEYVDMITAHGSYWQDPNLAAFVLVELFANQGDLARTGLVPAKMRKG
ncbi:hypothetical protein K439DRAFT_1641371 [Ramaria rubella]|nr:hypothetical protein K439DRAFT_1641371 [Ramaria rubella]